MNSQQYDWIVAGGGIAGIAIAELLCRDGVRVLLLEKNEQLVSETSKVFHEWMHSGALYTLVPDNLLTLRYLLGATDDLLEYYASFEKMNCIPTEKGILLQSDGWFNNDFIEYRYRIRKTNPIWMSLVSRSVNIIDLIAEHDWLRKRAGSEYGKSSIKTRYSFDKINDQFRSDEMFYCKKSPDFTMKSRILISDLLTSALNNGLDVLTECAMDSAKDHDKGVVVKTAHGDFLADKLVLCAPDIVSKLYKVPLQLSYAPIAVVEGVPDSEVSFVELDYKTKRCINLLKKENGVAQAGGISLNKESDVRSYLEYVIKEHKKRNPEISVIDTYVGLKRELVKKGENRNYLYHISQHSKRIWSVLLGKFSLAFSMAPEFYRRIHHKNPKKFASVGASGAKDHLISATSWQEIIGRRNKTVVKDSL